MEELNDKHIEQLKNGKRLRCRYLRSRFLFRRKYTKKEMDGYLYTKSNELRHTELDKERTYLANTAFIKDTLKKCLLIMPEEDVW